MNVNKSGYYKWCSRKGTKNRYEKDREILTGLLLEVHKKHRSYGYHRLSAVVRKNTGWLFTDNLAHKCCKFAGIKSRTRHYKWRKIGEEHHSFRNEICGNWNASRPLEIVVSDMTMLAMKGERREWIYMLDTFNNEIISSHLGRTIGDPKPYYECLEDLIKKTKEQTAPVTLHTDQGAIYSSHAFFNAHKEYNIRRSMSRVGTPTDNPIIEAINGWIKAELATDGWFNKYDSIDTMVNEYVHYFNNERPAYALGYISPVEYREVKGY